MTRTTFSLLAIFLLGLSPNAATADNDGCACEPAKRPDVAQKAATARWMVHSLDWGVVSSISSRLGSGDADASQAIPFGNVYSFVDGSCDRATGIPYLYGTYMDQTFKDTLNNDKVALTLSESSLASVCPHRTIQDSCVLGSQFGDPENPLCARLTLTGRLVPLEGASDEHGFAESAFFERHPSMKAWPNHGWVIARIEIEDIWLIDYFGGATVVDPKEYFAAGAAANTLESS